MFRFDALLAVACVLLPTSMVFGQVGETVDNVQPKEQVKKAVNKALGLKGVTYENRKYGFKIDCPGGVKVVQGEFEGEYLFQSNWRLDSVDGENNTGDEIVAISFYEYRGCEKDWVKLRIGASSEPADIKKCSEPGYFSTGDDKGPGGSGKTVKINGLPFFVSRLGDAAMMKSFEAESYRAVHNDTCYAIEVISYSSGRGACDPTGNEKKIDADMNLNYKRALAVVKTFRFMDSVKEEETKEAAKEEAKAKAKKPAIPAKTPPAGSMSPPGTSR